LLWIFPLENPTAKLTKCPSSDSKHRAFPRKLALPNEHRRIAHERVLFLEALSGEAKLEDTGIRRIRQREMSYSSPHTKAINLERLGRNPLNMREKSTPTTKWTETPLPFNEKGARRSSQEYFPIL
jgi:hypothetical protein